MTYPLAFYDSCTATPFDTADTIRGIALRAAGAARTQGRSWFAAIPLTGFLSALKSKAH